MSPFANHPDELISASLSGDLTAAERRELQAHLDGCPACRETLEAYRMQRQLLSGMAQPPIPRDLQARIRTGIESDRFAAPWWRRPGTFLAGFASLATVAAAALLVLFVVNQVNGPNVGQVSPTPGASSSPVASSSGEASPSAAPESPAPSATSAPIPLGMQPGDLLYPQVVTAADHTTTLRVVLNQTGQSVTLTAPSGSQFGAVVRAALSPDGRLLAFADEPGLKGTWRIFVANLADGSVQQLAETLPVTFGRRLAWSPDGRYLAFTVAPSDGNGATSDVWLYDRTTGSAGQLTRQANAYFASWAPIGPGDPAQEQLWVSLGAANPVSQLAQFDANGGIPVTDPLAGEATTVGGFAPLVSPDGSQVLYWTGAMAPAGTSGWTFSRGGMPHLAAYAASPTNQEWGGQLLFSDLSVQPNGAAFTSGELAWSEDSDTYAFWGAQWAGTPEGNGYPDPNGVYLGRVSSGQLSQASALDLGSMTSNDANALRVVDVGVSPDGSVATVTLGVPLAGDLSPVQSYLRAVPTGGGSVTDVGSGGAGTPPWSGPGVFVPTTLAP